MPGSASKADDPLKKYKRTYIACLNCRVRKVRCDLGELARPGDRCLRCQRERRDCVFVDSKKRDANRLRSEHARPGASPARSPDGPGLNYQDAPKHFSTMEGALVFLANAAGKIAKADERDNINAREKHSQLELAYRNPTPDRPDALASAATGPYAAGPGTFSAGAGPFPTTAGAYGRQAVRFPAEADPYGAGGPPNDRENSPRAENRAPFSQIPSYTNQQVGERGRLVVPPVENSYAARPEGSSDLESIEYIGENGILSVAEAEYLINMFFLTMHPYFPHIPQFLHSAKVLCGYPILLCAILTISSRYHMLESAKAQAKNIEVHDRLWIYVQRLISQTVWAEASTRSIGTVFAFLLFTEWNPRAIHWRWSDYANKADDFSHPKPDSLAATAEPAGLGAMRRSHRMAWMLIGSAVRLAQDTGYMDRSSKTFLATHIAEINSVTNMKRRSMLGYSLSEVDLDKPEITEDEMESLEDDEVKVLDMPEEEQISPDDLLQFTHAQKAQIELLQIMSVGHESLYGFKAQLGSLNQRQNLALLNIMAPMINSWGRKYKAFLKSAKTAKKNAQAASKPQLSHAIENESFIFEFNYTKLYIYSLALSPSPQNSLYTGKSTLKLDEISKSAKYIEQAFNAANEILQVAHRVHKLKMLRFMPVRWVTRIVRAVAFIVKCYLTITAHKYTEAGSDENPDVDATILSLSLISVEEIAQSIQKAAITIRDCSPDELHLCTRYSNILMYLYSEMRATLKKSQSGAAPQAESTEKGETAEHFETPEYDAKVGEGAGTPTFDMQGDSNMVDWFITNKNIGLDFVGPWTELIEQQLEGHSINFDAGPNFV